MEKRNDHGLQTKERQRGEKRVREKERTGEGKENGRSKQVEAVERASVSVMHLVHSCSLHHATESVEGQKEIDTERRIEQKEKEMIFIQE